MKALVRWCVFCAVTRRACAYHVDPAPWFAVADMDDLPYLDKLAAYRRLADEYFETDRYREFCADNLVGLDDIVLEYVQEPSFDQLLVDTVRATYPAHEHEQFIGHFRGLVKMWVDDEPAFRGW
jgi:hypothetical protein